MAERIKLDYIPAPTAIGTSFGEIQRFLTPDEMIAQAQRCPGCAAPTCQLACPTGNSIGDMHKLIALGQLRQAANLRYNETSALAGLLGSVCPQMDNGLCEDPKMCVSGRGDGESVMIGSIEASLAWHALQEGWINKPQRKPGIKAKNKSVGIIGSGAASLRAAEEAVRYGWKVTIYERDPLIGGLLTIGIPNFKLHSGLLAGVLNLFEDHPNIEIIKYQDIGKTRTLEDFAQRHDLIICANGAQLGKHQQHVPDSTPGVYQAVRDFLRPQSFINWGLNKTTTNNMYGKHVVVIGLGYTGIDCFNTAYYQGAEKITVLSKREPDPDNLEHNRNQGFNQYVLNEIERAKEKGIQFKFGREVDGYHHNGNCSLGLEYEGRIESLDADAVILARGFDIHDTIKPANERWKSAKNYNYKHGQIADLYGTPVLILGDQALKPDDRLVVKAAAQAANTFRAYHFGLYPEDNMQQAFVNGRTLQVQGLKLAA